MISGGGSGRPDSKWRSRIEGGSSEWRRKELDDNGKLMLIIIAVVYDTAINASYDAVVCCFARVERMIPCNLRAIAPSSERRRRWEVG